MRCLIALLIALATPAKALDYELAVGRSEFCCLENGIWWQSSFGFNGSTVDRSIELGARHRIGNWGLHGAYVDLGSASGHNPAVMRDDEFGRYNTAKPCDVNLQKNCLGFFGTNQRVHGLLAGVSYGYDIKGVRLEGELGQYLYQSEMRVSIWCPNCGVSHKYAFGHGGTFSSKSGMRRSSYFAIKAEYKNTFLTYRRFSQIDGSGEGMEGVETQFATGLTNGPVNQVMIGVKF